MNKPKPIIRVAWLYYDILNIYGDRGNILAFRYRLEKRGYGCLVDKISVGEKLKPDFYHFIFSGGGQDKQQELAGKDLQTKRSALEKYAENYVPMLLICGSYQLFGNYFLTAFDKKIPGISILNCHTIASSERKIGNVEVEFDKTFMKQNNSDLDISRSQDLVGFENHSGNTFINQSKTRQKSATLPLAKITKGAGNNGKDKTEGAYYKNVVGTYLHGSLLPKNPHMADFFVSKAILAKTGQQTTLKKLNDDLEWKTHFYCKKLKR